MFSFCRYGGFLLSFTTQLETMSRSITLLALISICNHAYSSHTVLLMRPKHQFYTAWKDTCWSMLISSHLQLYSNLKISLEDVILGVGHLVRGMVNFFMKILRKKVCLPNRRTERKWFEMFRQKQNKLKNCPCLHRAHIVC